MAFCVDRVHLFSIAVGTVLTGLLLWVLSSSVEPIDLGGPVASEVKITSEKQPLPAGGFVPSVASTASKQVNINEPVSIPEPSATPAPSVASPPNPPDSSQPALADPPPLPPELMLSPKEVSALSGEERAEYERMLETYQQIQAQAERLRKERERLENRVEDMEGRNKSLNGNLKDVRQLLKDAAPTEQHPPSTKDGGEP